MNQPSLIPIADRGNARYELEKDYSHRWYAEGHAWLIHIPAGFRLDGASVPWIGTVLTGIQRDGLHRAAALVHDYIYRYAGRLPINNFRRYCAVREDWLPIPVDWTREQADKLFANMLAQFGVSKFRRRLMYLAVRAVGWRSWKPKL